MARVKLSLPDTFQFSTEIPIRITDINYGGHLANDAVLALIHEARLQFLTSLNYSEKDIEGKGLIMTDAIVVYKSEGFYGEHVTIDLAVEDISRIGFDIVYRICELKSGREIARIKTGMAFFDYESRKIATTPETFSEKVFSKKSQGNTDSSL